MKKPILILTLLMLIALVAMPATAETLTGTIGGTATTSGTYVLADTGVGIATKIIYLNVNSIEYAQFTNSLVRFEYQKDTFAASTPTGNTSRFIATVGAQKVAEGIIGYQRLFDGAGAEGLGYTWITFDTNWSISGLTGDQVVTLTYQTMDNWAPNGWQAVTYPAADGDIYYSYGAARAITGSYIRQTSETSYSTYSFEKPSGIGIAGTVTKTNPSRVFVSNGTTPYSIITSDATITTAQLNATTTAQSIFVSMLTAGGIWYNTSSLFAVTAPAPGLITTWFAAIDGQTSGSIHGSNIQIHDETGSGSSSWVNTTGDLDGISYIVTTSSTTLAGYAQATGYTSTSRTGLVPVSDGLFYELIMWPTSQQNATVPWNVNLYVIVNDELNHQPLKGVNVQATVPSGATQATTTNAAGTATFQIANKTLIRLTASMPGYMTGTTTITTTDWGPDTKRIELQKATVAPLITATPLPGEVTARPTVDMRTATQKDADMMGQIRDFAPTLIMMAMFMTLMYMVGYKP